MTDEFSPLGKMDFENIETRVLVHMGLSLTQARALHRMAQPDIHCVDIPHPEDHQPLVDLALIEWVPAQAWSGRHTYALTDKGRALVKEIFNVH